MIFLIFIFFYSVTCHASHHDERAIIENVKRNLLSHTILGDEISSAQALLGLVLLKNIHCEEPTAYQQNQVRNKISTFNQPGYQVATVTLPQGEDQIRKQTVSYYKKSQKNSDEASNLICVSRHGKRYCLHQNNNKIVPKLLKSRHFNSDSDSDSDDEL